MKIMKWVFCVGALLTCGVKAAAAGAELPAARYQVRDGAFWDMKANRSFTPRGFNYIRLHRSHGTFDPEYYDRKATDALFAHLSQDGFNTVRVFINGYSKLTGAVARMGQTGLSREYVANVADFLRRADARNVAVVLSTDSYPRVPPFVTETDNRASAVYPENAEILERGNVEARARYLTALIEALRSADARCLDAVLAYDLQNEWCYVMAPPFTLTSGTARLGDGREFTLPAQRQALADDAAIYCIDTLADAVRAAHPRAPVWVGVFTYRAVGKTGPGDFRVEQKAWKNRVPFRPLAILRSKADVLDVHFYCENERVFEEDLTSIEFKAVRRKACERGAVLVAGEFGVFKRGLFTSANAAAEWISKVVPLFGQAGFGGWLYWTYDTHEQDAELWHACSGDGSIYKKLKKPALALEPGSRGRE